MKTRFQTILHEFEHHFPFTIFAVVVAVLALGILTELMPVGTATGPGGHDDHATCALAEHAGGDHHAQAPAASGDGHAHAPARSPWNRLFHLFHPMHILLSAAATTAMFWRYDRRLFMALFAGFIGSTGFCGISDIVFPWLGGRMMDAPMDLHICLLEHPHLVIPFAIMGIFAGLVAADAYSDRRLNIFSHSSHVLISTGASLLYLVGFGLTDWPFQLTEVFVIVFAAVIVPCCASDIFFPLLLVNPAGAHFCSGHCRDDVHPEAKPDADA